MAEPIKKDPKPSADPVVKDPPFFEWLEQLFQDTSFPESLDVRVVTGKQFERFGPQIRQIVFAPDADDAKKAADGSNPGRKKPTREELVALSNELMLRMQRDCDEQRKQVVYAIHAWHHGRGTEPYERWIKRCAPQGRWSKGDQREADDEDERTEQERWSIQRLHHDERMFALYGGAFEGLLDRYDRDKERDHTEIERLRERLTQQQEMLEKALSLEEERRERREWNALGRQSVAKAADMAFALAPAMLGNLTGKKLATTGETPESYALKKFFTPKDKGGQLTEEQSHAAFGVYEDQPPHNLIRPGVLNTEQARLLYDVAQCNLPADDLDKLINDGPLKVTGEQLMQLQQIFPMEQIAPLLVLVSGRMQRRQSKQVTQ